MKLRPYQEKILSEIKQAFAKGMRRVIMQLATGGGKTAMFSAIAKMAIDKGNSVLIITDRKELLSQSSGTLSRFGLITELLTAKTKKLTTGILYVAMVETIKSRIAKPGYADFVQSFKIIVIDECHKNSFNRIFESLHDDQYVIGATATPYRNGKMPELKEDYDTIIQGIQIKELQELGYLSKAISYGVQVDLSSVRVTAGEFNPADLEGVYNKLYSGAVENYLQHVPNSKALAFSPTVATSEALCFEFNAAGISAKHLDAETEMSERERILAQFAAGEFRILCNVGILTTGYDCPDIETIIIYRATKSLPLFLQMCGRGSRVAPGKEKFNILDFGNNVKRHDFWESDRIWTLENDKKPRSSEKKDAFPVKECPECGALLRINVRTCEYCGYEYPVKETERQKAILSILTASQINRIAEFGTVQELEEIRVAKEYKIGWVLHKLKTKEEFEQYEKLKGYKRGWAFIQWRNFNRG